MTDKQQGAQAGATVIVTAGLLAASERLLNAQSRLQILGQTNAAFDFATRAQQQLEYAMACDEYAAASMEMGHQIELARQSAHVARAPQPDTPSNADETKVTT